MSTIFCHLCGESEKGSPQRRTRQGLGRAAPEPVGPERETGSWWLIPVAATVSYKAEMHSLLLSLLKIHHVLIKKKNF